MFVHPIIRYQWGIRHYGNDIEHLNCSYLVQISPLNTALQISHCLTLLFYIE